MILGDNLWDIALLKIEYNISIRSIKRYHQQRKQVAAQFFCTTLRSRSSFIRERLSANTRRDDHEGILNFGILLSDRAAALVSVLNGLTELGTYSFYGDALHLGSSQGSGQKPGGVNDCIGR